MDTGADVAVLVRSCVVAVHVEQAVVLVLVVVATDVQHHARSVVVAVVVQNQDTDPLVWYPCLQVTIYL